MLRKEAKKVFIAEILKGKFVPADVEAKRGAYVITSLGEKVSRVNLVGTVIDKFEGSNFVELKIDDGSDSIKIRAFNDFERLYEIEPGDLVNVIGKIREFNDEIYINAEIVRKVNFAVEIFRKFEICERILERKSIVDEIRRIARTTDELVAIEFAKEKYGFETEVTKQILAPQKIDYTEKIFELIKNLEGENGIELSEIFEISDLPENIIEKALNELLEEGKIYEPQPGRFKAV